MFLESGSWVWRRFNVVGRDMRNAISTFREAPYGGSSKGDLMRRPLLLVLALVSALMCGGCSYYTAAIPPRPKNIGLLTPGVPRTVLLAEFGPPVLTEIRDGTRGEIFRFIQGYAPPPPTSRGAAAAAAVTDAAGTVAVAAEGVANVATLGAWSGPHPPALMGPEVMVEVTYTREDDVLAIAPIKGGDLVADAVGTAYSDPIAK